MLRSRLDLAAGDKKNRLYIQNGGNFEGIAKAIAEKSALSWAGNPFFLSPAAQPQQHLKTSNFSLIFLLFSLRSSATERKKGGKVA